MWATIIKQLGQAIATALIKKIGKPILLQLQKLLAIKKKRKANDKLKDIADPSDRRDNLP